MNRKSFKSASDVESATEIPPSPYNPVRLRFDTWNYLRDAARRLRHYEQTDSAGERTALVAACTEALSVLHDLECYFAFPGHRIVGFLRDLLDDGEYADLGAACIRLVRMLTSGSYRRLDLSSIRPSDALDLLRRAEGAIDRVRQTSNRPYFEVLVVDDVDEEEADATRQQFRALRDPSDQFQYEVIVVQTFEDALLAVTLNPTIQACVLRFSFPFGGTRHAPIVERLFELAGENREAVRALMPGERTARLGQMLKAIRPEIDTFRVTSAPVEAVVGGQFKRVYYQSEDVYDLHVTISHGIHDRFETPFFDALRRYSERPKGMFHALPVSRARTIAKSHWIDDFGEFYGRRLFFAETSATTGGLDSLLQPTGSLKRAQELAARAFGADRTFFVTNGTSTANKIVMQALCRPGDIVLLSHDCHKSHPYAVILAGAFPVYLDAYPLTPYSMYGGVPLTEIKHQLRALERAGKLDRVRLLLLTNLTFDGVTYDVFRVMQEILAIKHDIIFLWDEAWFAYGRFSPLTRRRTAMDSAARLESELRTKAYKKRYDAWKAAHPERDAVYEDGALPDPDKTRLRVYATHSTHKTLTALRQGSMIHIRDIDFERSAQEPFHEAYMTHTSTSPNYQILASLDVGRRQAELEGYDFVTSAIEHALLLRERINEDDLLAKYFRALTLADMVPDAYRTSGLQRYIEPDGTIGPLERAWAQDEFVLDPTRVTLHVGRTGMDGDTFKKLLMEKYDIHINKTSRNTVLFLIHIGASRSAIAHLVKVLTDIAVDLEARAQHSSPAERGAFDFKVASLTEHLPPLPNFSAFHPRFKSDASGTPEGNMREAYFLAYDPLSCEYLPLDRGLRERVAAGAEVVSAGFVTPYPPGFPVLVPGQLVSAQILDYLLALDVKEIHGFNPELGLLVFKEEALRTHQHESKGTNGASERARSMEGN